MGLPCFTGSRFRGLICICVFPGPPRVWCSNQPTPKHSSQCQRVPHPPGSVSMLILGIFLVHITPRPSVHSSSHWSKEAYDAKVHQPWLHCWWITQFVAPNCKWFSAAVETAVNQHNHFWICSWVVWNLTGSMLCQSLGKPGIRHPWPLD